MNEALDVNETLDEVGDRLSDEPPSQRSALSAALASPWSNLALFLATVVSTFFVGAQMVSDGVPLLGDALSVIERVRNAVEHVPDALRGPAHVLVWNPLRGWIFAVPLLAILVTHEMGHWLFARKHRVEASLPYFLPLPIPPLGTLGAVIAMRGRIKTRDALLDIGASGPIAGLLVAIPVLVIGLRLSVIERIPEHGIDEGQSLFYLAMKRIVLGPIPSTHDVFLHPTAFAGWAGLLMTMLNLVPVGQLDGGHIAYALFGPRQDVYSKRVRYGLLAVAAVAGLVAAYGKLRAHAPWSDVGDALFAGKNWIFWFGVLWLLTRGTGAKHPPTEPGALSPGRRVVAWVMLLTFVSLFMPVIISEH